MGFDDSTKRVLESFEKHVRQMAWHIHEVEVGVADELNLWRIEETVMILAHEACVLDGFLSQITDVCLCADDADVIRVRMGSLISQGNVLTNQHTDADTGHVETVEESLDIVVYLHSLTFAFVFENALCNGCHDAIVTAFDLLERLGEASIEVVQLGRPVIGVIAGAIVTLEGILSLASVLGLVELRAVLALVDTRVLGSLAQYARVLAILRS